MITKWFESWWQSRKRQTLGDAADEVRELCARYEYELDTGDRRDRDAWEDEST